MPEPVDHVPVATYIAVDDGYAALAFYKTAFAAEVGETYDWNGRLGHATLKINGGQVMMSDEADVAITGVRSPKSLGGTTCTLSLTVEDVDAWYSRACAAGCETIRAPSDEFYGRMAKVRDPYGHTWGFVGPTRGG